MAKKVKTNKSTKKVEAKKEKEVVTTSNIVDTAKKVEVTKSKDVVVSSKPKCNFWKNNKGTLIIVGIVVLLVALTLLIEGNEKPDGKTIDYSTLSEAVQTWYADTQSNEYVITVLALSTCGYCQQYHPVISDIAENEGIKLHWFEMDTLDANDANALTNTYKLEQYSGSAPYTVITYGGEFVKDVVGYMPQESTIEFLKENGVIK